jgi:hypothetical protein
MDAYSYEGRMGGMDEIRSERVEERRDEGMVKGRMDEIEG